MRLPHSTQTRFKVSVQLSGMVRRAVRPWRSMVDHHPSDMPGGRFTSTRSARPGGRDGGGFSLVAYKRSMENPGTRAIGAGTSSDCSTTHERPSASRPVVRNCTTRRAEQRLPSLLGGSQPITTGIFPQPRLLPLATGRNSAFSRSTSQSGKYLSTSSRTTRPSTRAERGTQAEMRTMPESQVLPDLAVDVEAIGVGENALITVP